MSTMMILSPKEPAFVLAGSPCQCGPTGQALGPEGGWGVAQEGNFVNKHPDFLSKMRGGFYVQARWPTLLKRCDGLASNDVNDLHLMRP